MTAQDNYAPTKTLGNGSTTEFTFNWRMFNSSYSRVYLEDVTTGKQVLQTLGSDYTLIFDTSGGTVTFTTAPTSDDYVIVSREIALTQDTNYTTSQGFQGDVTENSFDLLTAMVQDVQEEADRQLSYPLGTDTGTISSEIPTPVAGQVLTGNLTGTAYELTSTSDALPNTADTYVRRNSANTLWEAKTPTQVKTELFALADTDDLTEGSTNLYDKTVVLTDGTGITVTGTYPNFTITNSQPNSVSRTDFPIGYKGIVSNDSVTPDELIDVTAVKCWSSDLSQYLEVAADTDIDITANASWASGTAPSLTDATVSVWADYNSGTQRYILDDITGSNIGGAKRRVCSFLTDSSGDIIPFTIYELPNGYDLEFNTPVIDYNGTSESSGLKTVSVPVGISVQIKISGYATGTAGNDSVFVPPSSDVFSAFLARTKMSTDGSGVATRNQDGNVWTDTSAQLRYISDAAINTYLGNFGYIDERTV